MIAIAIKKSLQRIENARMNTKYYNRDSQHQCQFAKTFEDCNLVDVCIHDL